MTDYKELIERLYKNHKDYGEGRTKNFFWVSLDCKEAADAIETLTAELAEERHRHDRLQDWDRGLTEQGEILKRLINGEWVDSCDVEAALGFASRTRTAPSSTAPCGTWSLSPARNVGSCPAEIAGRPFSRSTGKETWLPSTDPRERPQRRSTSAKTPSLRGASATFKTRSI